MSGERGTITLWMLGLCMMLLALGGMSLDLWRGFSERRELAAMADSGAVAGASGVDLEHYRATGQARLDSETATKLALAAVAFQPGASDLASPPSVEVPADGSSITVVLAREVDFTLLKLLAAGRPPFLVRVSATALPQTAP